MIKKAEIVTLIIEGIQEKKGKKIAVVDMRNLPDSPCGYFVIAEGESGVQVNAIAQSVKDWLNDKGKQKPYAFDGFENNQWIALDYGEAIVHIFQREFRNFYDLEHLWEDANIELIPDLDEIKKQN